MKKNKQKNKVDPNRIIQAIEENFNDILSFYYNNTEKFTLDNFYIRVSYLILLVLIIIYFI